MRKKYTVRGMMEWHPVFKAGRARIQVSFTGGHLGDGCITPASFETSDIVLQRVIEKSSAFRSGRIRLSATVREEGDSEAGSAAKAKADIKERPAVRKAEAASLQKDLFGMQTMVFESMDAAAEYLHEEKGIPLARLMEAEECRAEAVKIGINLKIGKKK